MKRIISLAVAIVATAALAAPANAGKPVPFYEGPFTESLMIADCGDFIAQSQTEGYARIDLIFDCTGNPVRLAAHAQGIDTLFNASHPEKSISGKFSWNAQQDLPDGAMVRSGLFWHIVLPGYGPLVMETGRWEQQADGSWMYLSGLAVKDTEVLCAALR
jgi:hypothetical protein